MKNGRFKMFAILFLAFATILQTFPGNMWGGVSRLYAAQNAAWFSGSSYNSINQTLQFNFSNETDYNKVTGVMVNDTTYESVTSTFSVRENKFYKLGSGYSEYYFLLPASLNVGDTVKFITNNGWYELKINNPAGMMGVHDKNSVRFVENTATEPEHKEEQQHKEQTVKVKLKAVSDFGNFYFTITPMPENGIKSVSVNDIVWSAASSKWTVWNGNNLYFYESGELRFSPGLKEGNVIKLEYGDGTIHSFTYPSNLKNGNEIEEMDTVPAPKVLKLRLRGYFEAAIVGQKKYDGISSATLGGANSNKNSDVVLEGTYAENPEDKDWQPYEKLGIRNTHPQLLLDEKSGMKGKYNSFDDKSQFTLEGTPAEPGKYEVKASVDINGKTVTTENSLTFSVYATNGTLSEYLNDGVLDKTSTFRKMQDNKYIWDMEPWVITKFGGTNETVTVPTAVKAWYGSHTSGTYGELGFVAADEIPTQTLIVDKNTNLTLVNMKVLSSVKIIVRNGGVLNLMDSSVHGKIEVENGGKLQVNYDVYHNKITQGSSINGQVELKDGGILENSLIYSNTNYLPNGTEARHNVEPVVKVTGNATIRGKVYIRGDEAPTGTDPKTGKTYTGQPALSVENATLNVEKDANLWLAGGGKMMITTYGAPGLKLNNGTVTGEGNLISFAGTSTREEGRPAVEGNGTLQTAKMYLVGGDTYDKTKGGKVLSEGIKIGTDTIKPIGKLVKGRNIGTTTDTSSKPGYQSYTQTEPNLNEIDFGNDEIKVQSGEVKPGKPEQGNGQTKPDKPEQGNKNQGNEQTKPDKPEPGNGQPQPGNQNQGNGQPQSDNSGNQSDSSSNVPVVPENTQAGQNQSTVFDNTESRPKADITETADISDDRTPEGEANVNNDAMTDNKGKAGKSVKATKSAKADKADVAEVEDDKMPLGKAKTSENERSLPKTGGAPVELYVIAGLSLMILGFKVKKQR